jgi:predicted phosphodiesterase
LICLRHDHSPQCFSLAYTLFFNPGSLCCSHDEYARYGIITIEQDQMVCETKQAAYDRKGFLQGYLHKQVPAKETILRIFYDIN